MKTLIIIVFFLFIAAQSYAATDYELYLKSKNRSPEWDEFVKAGFESLGTKVASTGMIFMEKAIAKGCKDPIVQYKLAKYYESVGKIDRAMELMQGADLTMAQSYPNSAYSKKIPRELGELFFQKGDFKEALKYLERSFQVESEDPLLALMLGQSVRRTSDLTKAKSLLEKALALSLAKGSTELIYPTVLELMTLNYQLSDFDSSLAYAEEILKADPTNSTARSYREKIIAKRLKERERESIKKLIK